MSLKKKELGLWSFFAITSLICSIWLFFVDHSLDNYTHIAALPAVFFLCSVVFIVVYKKVTENIGLLFLHCLMYIRLVVTPFFMTQAGFSSIFKGITEANVNRAITLMCYECVMVYLVLALMVMHSRQKEQKLNAPKTEYVLQYRRPSLLFRVIVLVMVVYCVAVWIFIPTCRELYKTIFEFGDESFTIADYVVSAESAGSLTRSLQTLFKLFFDIVRLVLPMTILIALKRRGGNSFFPIVIGLLFAALQLFFISQTTSRAVLCAFLIIYFVSKLYPKHAKLITQIAVVVSVGVIVSYFAIRFNVGSRYGSNANEYISKILGAYFGGLDNVAAGANIPEGHEASTFFASLYSSIPFNSTLFGLKVENLQSIFNAVNRSYGQIPPMVVESAYYFGSFFAPVLSCICAFCAYFFGERFSKTDSLWYLISYLFLSVLCAISIVMYNEEIFLVWLLEWLVPMMILSKLADRERR